jgi:hypothetical protein
MKALTISDSETMVLALQDEIRRSQEARYDHRLHAVLLVAQGMTCPEAAKFLGDSPRTVQYWIRRFEEDGFAGLADADRPGRPRKLSARHIDLINQALRKSPRDVGFSTGRSFLIVQSDSRSRENFLGLPFLSILPSALFCLSRSSLSFSLETGLEAERISRASTAMPSLMVTPCCMELCQKGAVELHHGLFGQTAAKPGESGVIRSRLIHGQSQKGLKGDPIVDLAFQFGIRGDLKPFLQHQALEQQQRRIGLAAFGALSGVIELVEQQLDRLPVNRQIQLFEHGQGAVFIGMDFDGKISEGKVTLGFSVSHYASCGGWVEAITAHNRQANQ